MPSLLTIPLSYLSFLRIIKARAPRNPLLAEKTPRTFYQNKSWTYEPPQGQAAQDKWHYSEEEVGLVSQLGSMVEKVKKEKQRQAEHCQRIKQFQDQMLGATKASARTGRSIQEGELATARTETARSQSTSRLLESARLNSSRPGLHSIDETPRAAAPEKTLFEYPITSIKTLQSSHPEILSKVRAERAAKYVEELSNPLLPPDYSHVSSRIAFRPGGGSLNYNQTRELPGKRGGGRAVEGGNKTFKGTGSAVVRSSRGEGSEAMNTERMKESLKSLVKALDETESELARQDLKIALAKKVKTFEKRGPQATTRGGY
jgi:hypothetical protein